MECQLMYSEERLPPDTWPCFVLFILRISARKQPQLLVTPFLNELPRTMLRFPQAQRQSYSTKPFECPFDGIVDSTISFPNFRPIIFGGLRIVLSRHSIEQYRQDLWRISDGRLKNSQPHCSQISFILTGKVFPC